MVFKQSTAAEAYAILGLEQGASLEIVKSTYKQLALKTHPDKNPGDEDATAQFQRISEAYNTLVKHLDRSSAPSHSHSPSQSHYHFHPFGYDDDDYDYDDYEDDDDFYDEAEYDYEEFEEERMEFYRFLFEEIMRGQASRFAHARYQRHRQHDRPPPETTEEYSARLRRAREEQEKAAERRARDEANRKANQERERENERREAEKRQRAKASAKKVEAEASRRAAEQKARSQQEQAQNLRSQIFAAARRKDAAAVKKGVYEQNVDASGGELRSGSEKFVKEAPTDTRETLLHIAAKNGDADLVQWLDSHGAEIDERNKEDMTAFHLALRGGYSKVIQHLFESYPPGDSDYEAIYRSPSSDSNLKLALVAEEPEMVWIVLDKHLYTQQEIDDAWEIVSSKAFKLSISSTGKYDEFMNLFSTFGGYSLQKPPSPEPESPPATQASLSPSPAPPAQKADRSAPRQNGKFQHSRRPRPTVKTEDVRSHTASPASAVSENLHTPTSGSPSTNSPRGSRGQHIRRGSYRPNQQQQPYSPDTEPTSPQNGVNPQQDYRGRGRGRGRGYYRGRGRGRGRGEAPVAVPSA